MSSRDLAKLQLKSLAAENAEFFPITVDIYNALIADGTIPEGAPLELLGGHIVRKDRSEGEDGIMTVGPGHILVVKRLARLGPKFESLGCHIQTKQPILLTRGDVPEPDATVIRGSEEQYAKKLASAPDISCVIEVSDHSLGNDQGAKLLLYASVGIGCYVVINLRKHVILVNTNPTSERTGSPEYASKQELKAGDVLAIPTPDGRSVVVAVRDLLP